VNKQIVISLSGLICIAALFFFGSTVAPKIKMDKVVPATASQFNIDQFIKESKSHLTPSQSLALGKLENSVTRGDVNSQLVQANTELGNFWKDSIHIFEPYAFYMAQAAKLDKSEKNLTFAARLILDNLRSETDDAKIGWKAEQAISLFEQAIVLDPDNDDLKVGLGSCYVFGKGRIGGPTETMKGIQLLLGVVKRDSSNMKAQLVLGVGGYVSGQYDKAVDRLLKVIKADPGNLEAIAFLADTYAAKGDKTEAVKWYTISKRMVNNPQYTKEVDERIKQMR
jgi:tetratricopeptide (TPR) repeat protein